MEMHYRLGGKVSISSRMEINSPEDLSLAYTPGVAAPCEAIAEDPCKARALTIKNNAVAVVTNGSAVLGLGNIGPLAAQPLMEGKAMLFKEFAGIDAWPLCLDTQDSDKIVDTIRLISPVFGGINLEDISAPRCFEIEKRLLDLGIPVFHDDQHGTAIVLLAGLINAARVTQRRMEDLQVVINGAGAAGIAISRLLRCIGQHRDVCTPVKDVIICDSQGIIHRGRDGLPPIKQELLVFTNRENRKGSLRDALAGADVFIGVSKGNLLQEEDVRVMADDPVIFAMANPDPEIMPERARNAGAAVIGTGRSDFPNQINNVLVFPGLFRGALDSEATTITDAMKIAAAGALADIVSDPVAACVLPDPLDKKVASGVAQAVQQAWRQ